MLRMKNLDNRTFEERFGEALTELPLLTPDWTNFNASDPGVTILENLTAFNNLQLGEISEISDEVRFAILKMCGFETKRGKTSKVLLKGNNLTEEVYLPANKQLWLGDMCFETERVTKVYPYQFTGVFGYYDREYHNKNILIFSDVENPTTVFGDNPTEGDMIYFIADGMPEPEEELICRVSVLDRHNRNPFLEKGNNIFASLEWQIYTVNGFETLKVKDASAGFLLDGEIRIRMPKTELAVFDETPTKGYCIRAILRLSQYDVVPKLTGVEGFLFEVFQKETLSSALTFQKSNNVRMFNDMADEGYIRVFAKEKKGSSYYMYDQVFSGEGIGRYYDLVKQGPGMYDIVFDKNKYGYEPERLKNTVKVLVYSDKMMKQYAIGKIRGYDNETIMLPINSVVPVSFSIMARRIDENGDYIYDFARPERSEDGALYYHLYETEGRIVIEDPGDYIGAELFIATASVSRGEEGNIRSGSVFRIDEGEFINPGRGVKGCHRETLSELHRRFLLDLQRPYTAVTEMDYEILVKEIPQLCIKKVKVYADHVQNLVRVAVMPGTDEEFPMLSDLYKKEIGSYLEMRRLLTTRIEIVQPVYVPVNVYGTIYVKKQYSNFKDEIEAVIKESIDYLNNSKNFGETLSFNQIFHAVEELPCVEYIYDLSLVPFGAGNVARVKDSDVIIRDNVLLYPGEISLDMVAYTGEVDK